jgi:hypothetical protein
MTVRSKLDELHAKADALNLEPHRTRRGFVCKCPVHDDHNPSFSVDLGADKILLLCRSGCDTKAALTALGFEWSDVFKEGSAERKKPALLATFDYLDETGNFLFQVCRFEGKSFRQRRPDGNGGWIWNLDGTRRVLFHLPELLEAIRRGNQVLVVEGEKDVLRLGRDGFTATCNAGGAGKWRDEYSEVFQGAQVAILPDNDEPGRKHAEQTARSIARHAADVRIVELPDLPEGGDVSDWFTNGGSVEGFKELLSRTRRWEEADVQLDPRPPVLADLLTEAKDFIRRFVIFADEHQEVAVTLWVAHCYAIKAAFAAAYLRVKSAAEESGKTTLLEVLKLLLGDHAVNGFSLSPSSVFRLRDKVGAVALLFDEVDNALRNRQDEGARDLLALVNAGYRRSSASVWRTVGNSFEPKEFKVFGPAAISGIGQLHSTTESRCIPIELKRKIRKQGDRWIPFLVEDEGQALGEGFRAWANDETVAALRSATPDIPEGLRDRHVEVWWGMWAIADMAGGEWPDAARKAALALHGGADAEAAMSAGVLLLNHIRAAFEEARSDRLSTVQLLRRLVEIEEGPWGKWWGAEVARSTDSEPPTAAAVDLAKHLRPFGIKPKVIKMPDGSTPRGYLREGFEEGWSRYLPPLGVGGATPATPATPLASTVAPVAPVAGGMPNEGEAAPEEDNLLTREDNPALESLDERTERVRSANRELYPR